MSLCEINPRGQFFTKSFLGDGVLAPWATLSSRRRVDGVEVDTTIQHERAVKFDFHTVVSETGFGL